MRGASLALLLALCGAVQALPWSFGEPLTVTGAGDAPHYHHLDGAGRRHVAADAKAVAVAWEDDRDGAPQVYLALKPHAADAFAATYRLSDGREAYEPALVALGDGRWVAAWEQDGAIRACLVDADGPGPAVSLVASGGRQVTLAADTEGRLAAVWAHGQGGGQRVEAALLRIDARRPVVVGEVQAVAPLEGQVYQGYPAATWARDGGLVVAWEDRRAGHTRLYHARGEGTGPFGGVGQLNEHNAPHEEIPGVAGLGSGVMRVMLATDGDGAMQTIWLDKRNPASGYAVWGAGSSDGGRHFGTNRIVQDELGATVPQWHAALAPTAHGFVAAWDDTREAWGEGGEAGDVLLSWTEGDTWSADLVVPGASGDGYQGSPAVAVDPAGDLHLVWIEADDLSGPTRLRYLRGRRGD